MPFQAARFSWLTWSMNSFRSLMWDREPTPDRYPENSESRSARPPPAGPPTSPADTGPHSVSCRDRQGTQAGQRSWPRYRFSCCPFISPSNSLIGLKSPVPSKLCRWSIPGIVFALLPGLGICKRVDGSRD